MRIAKVCAASAGALAFALGLGLVPEASAQVGGGGGGGIGGCTPAGCGGAVGALEYDVSVDEDTGAVNVCVALDGSGGVGGEVGEIGGGAGGETCVTIAPPGSGVDDPLTADLQLGIPTPEGVAAVNVSVTATDDRFAI